jgi:hypothetical protein
MVAESIRDLHVTARRVELLVGGMIGDRLQRRPMVCGARNVARTQREQRRIEPDRSGALLHDARDLMRTQPPAEHAGAAHAIMGTFDNLDGGDAR